jgi:hypothetical protein
LNGFRSAQVNSSVGHRQIDMLRRSTIQLLVLFAVVGVPFVSADPKPTTEDVTGVVVAYDDIQANWVPCSDKCDGSLVVRVDAVDSAPRYIRVDLKYRSRKFPKQLLQTNARWRFRLVRTPTRDEPLYQFVVQAANAYGPEKHWPIWRVISTGEKLPFEQTIVSYSLDGFKQIR